MFPAPRSSVQSTSDFSQQFDVIYKFVSPPAYMSNDDLGKYPN